MEPLWLQGQTRLKELPDNIAILVSTIYLNQNEPYIQWTGPQSLLKY